MEAYLAHERSHEVDREDQSSVEWFPHIGLGGDMLGIHASEIITDMKTANYVRDKNRAWVLSVVSKPGHRKTLVEVAEAISWVLDVSADFLDAVADVPVP